ncbi:MAG: helix-turn-helix domain-containing protein [Clostridia bacterium]|nr:helix-turn-helix domain-containing protein [Clostridia bacterium]
MLRIKEVRKSQRITAKQLADYVCVAESTMSLYENGKREPDYRTLVKIAEFLNVTTDYLLGQEDNKKTPQRRGVKIPVLGNVAAGIPIEAITDIEDYEEINEELAAQGEYVALKIHGDSMLPRMLDGDVVIVKLQDTIESGETAIVIVNGGDATCKRIQKTPDGISLISINPAYAPMFYTNKQIEELPVRIFGKVVELRGKF